MSRSYFDSAWYRVADLTLRLRAHVQIHRQRFRGQTWFVVQDHQSGRFHRLSPGAHLLVSLLDGRRTVGEAWEAAGERLGEEQPGQTETIRLLSQLHRADLLLGELPPDIDEVATRAARQQRRKLWQKIKSPLSVRLPLLDPNAFLDASFPFVAWLFSRAGACLWLAVVATGAALAGIHWDELTRNLVDRVLVADNLAQMAVAYCGIKALHELGHGYAVKRWGGEVHEVGIVFLVFFPVPYVDASTSISFRSRWQRAAVGAAGIAVELFLAGAAMIAWTLLEPGATRAFVYNVMAIGGLSTLLVNGNPLLRFDGYYVLCDWLGIPNLASRSNQYLAYLAKTRLLGLREIENPARSRSEAAWLAGYSAAAFLYRLLIVFAIAFFVADAVPIVGIPLALWIVASAFLMPLWKLVRFLLIGTALQRTRPRVLAISACVVAALVAALTLVPIPRTTVVEGVLTVPENARVRTLSEGTVERIVAAENARVAEGDPLVILEDPLLATRVAVLAAQREEFALRLAAARVVDRVQARVIEEQLAQIDERLAVLRQRSVDLTVRAPASGTFVLPDASDLPGRYFARGSPLGFLLTGDPPRVQALVDQDDIDPVRSELRGIQVRFFEAPGRVVEARLARETPAAIRDLPSQALATAAGGDVAMDPSDPQSRRMLERMFEVELALGEAPPSATVGARVLVRFEHEPLPLAPRLYREVRQLFLRQLDV